MVVFEPQEQQGPSGPSAANVVVFEKPDVQFEGARYELSAYSAMPSARMEGETEKTDGIVGQTYVSMKGARYESHPNSVVLSADDSADRGWQWRLPENKTDRLELECTCCGGCKGTPEQPCEQWCCKGSVTLCFKCNVGVEAAAAADAEKPHCTDEACFRHSVC